MATMNDITLPEEINERLSSLGLKGVQQLITFANALVSNPDDEPKKKLLAEWLVANDTLDAVYSQWDKAVKTSDSALLSATLTLLNSLLRLPFLPSREPAFLRRLLTQYAPQLSKSVHTQGKNDVTTAALKLANVVVGMGGGRFRKRLWKALALEGGAAGDKDAGKTVARLLKTRLKHSPSPLTRPSIRVLLSFLALSFLLDPVSTDATQAHTKLKTEVLASPGLLGGIIKGLKEDEEEVVKHVLDGLGRVLANRSLPLDARRAIVDEKNILALLGCFDVAPLRTHVLKFFDFLAGWLVDQLPTGAGAASKLDTQHLGTGGTSPLAALGNLLKGLQVMDDPEQRELGLKILRRAPRLYSTFWNRFPTSLDPRLSSRWITSLLFANSAICLPVPSNLSGVPIGPLLFPQTLGKTWYARVLAHESPLVAYLGGCFLLSSLQKAEALLALPSITEEERKKIAEVVRAYTPELGVVLKLLEAPANAAGGSTGERKKKKQKVSEEVDRMDVDAPASPETDLRSNLGLRLAWLYRTLNVPISASSSHFDWASRLAPFLSASFTSATAPAALEGEREDERQGRLVVREISVGLAVQLLGAQILPIGWSKPADRLGDVKLFLEFVASQDATAKNAKLALGVLGDVLDSPVIFGTAIRGGLTVSGRRCPEVDVWLRALELDPTQAGVLLKLVAAVLQRTVAADEQDSRSPLLAGLLGDLAAGGKETAALASNLFLALLGSDLGDALETAKEVAAKAGSDGLKAILAVFGEAGKKDKKEKKKKDSSKGATLSLTDDNVFDGPSESWTTASSELLACHVRAQDLEDLTAVTALGDLIAARGDAPRVLQLLLRRYRPSLGTPFAARVLPFIARLVTTAAAGQQQSRAKQVVFGPQSKNNLLVLVADAGLEAATRKELVAFVALLLSPSDPADAALASPAGDALVDDLALAESSPDGLSAQGAPLIPLLSLSQTLRALEILSSRLAKNSKGKKSHALLSPLLNRANAFDMGKEAFALWQDGFAMIVNAAEAEDAGACRFLLAGSKIVMPVSLSGQELGEAGDHVAARIKSPSQADLTAWTKLLLAAPTTYTNSSLSATLSAFLLRSKASRVLFSAHLDQGTTSLSDVAQSEAICSFLVVLSGLLRDSDASLPKTLVAVAGDLTLAALGKKGAPWHPQAVNAAASASESARSEVLKVVTAAVDAMQRDDATPVGLETMFRLRTSNSAAFGALFGSYIERCLEALVRRFAEDKEDTAATLAWVEVLRTVVAKSQDTLIQPSQLDPLIVAALSNRLDQLAPLQLVRDLVEGRSYSDSNIAKYLNLIFSHSVFKAAQIVDAEDSPIQHAILELIVSLCEQSAEAAVSSDAPTRLARLYGGTLSSIDRNILEILRRCEATHQPLAALFDEWSPPGAATSGADVWAALTPAWVRASISYALSRSLDTVPLAAEAYDPDFLLPLLALTVVDGTPRTQEWLGLLESGAFAVAFASLASSSPIVRQQALAVLSSTASALQGSALKEKDEVLLVLHHARNCVFSAAQEPLPASAAALLAQAMLLIGQPESNVYPALMRFLQQRPLMDQRDVPMLYLSLYSSSDEPAQDRAWLMEYLSQSLVRSQDWRILRRRQTTELFLGLLQSGLREPQSRLQSLRFLVRVTSIAKAARELLARNSLLDWLSQQVPVNRDELDLFVKVLHQVTRCMEPGRVWPTLDVVTVLSRYLQAQAEISTLAARIACELVVWATAASSKPLLQERLLASTSRSILARLQASLPFAALKQVGPVLIQAVARYNFARERVEVPETEEDSALVALAARLLLATEDSETRLQLVLATNA